MSACKQTESHEERTVPKFSSSSGIAGGIGSMVQEEVEYCMFCTYVLCPWQSGCSSLHLLPPSATTWLNKLRAIEGALCRLPRWKFNGPHLQLDTCKGIFSFFFPLPCRTDYRILVKRFSTETDSFVDLILLKTFQNLSVSSPAPVTMASPSGDMAR